ncbi:hypothetical protein VB780_03420 [Leptolyngbya sp. CCNP1308]|uniref:hypothetical protein n=1 Tax=Leptolyngbya sp. CCNP1308 TaxID=3110255 RepID=UPI002B20E99C|nr:hypothetical protein [Leptolyngbya sp. CCNP1308]MEA5447604.1 hypothetical protein [Leptolyngbya sp. CCNP1308]
MHTENDSLGKSSMQSDYNTAETQKGIKQDLQLANIRPHCPRTVAAFYALPEEEILPKARQHLGYRSSTPIARLLRSYFIRTQGVDNILAAAAGEILLSIVCNAYRMKTRSNPERLFKDKIPVSIIRSKLTGQDYETCEVSRGIITLSGAFFEEVLEPLEKIYVDSDLFGRMPLLEITPQKKGQCRTYNVMGLQVALSEQIQHGWEDVEIVAKSDYSKPAGLSDDFNSGNLKPFTIDAANKFANAEFEFNVELFSRKGAQFIHALALSGCPEWTHDLVGQKAYLARLTSLLGTLGTMDAHSKEQFVGMVHMTSCGRLYPEGGGIVNLPKPLRWLLIGTPHKGHVLVDIDLKSCQMVALATILKCDESLEQILDIIHNGKSLWEHLAPKGFDLKTGKPALKQLIYSFCFGMQLSCLQQETNKKLAKMGVGFRFNKEQIDEILASPVMAPLVEARERFFKKYSLEAIDKLVQGKRKVVIENELGLSFNLKERAEELRAEALKKGKKPDEVKIAGKLLAHLAQGSEQAVMQQFLASAIISKENDVYPINFQYDGCTLSVHMDRVNEVLAQCDEWMEQNHPNHKFEAETLWFLNHPSFRTHCANHMLETEWILSGRYKKMNHDSRGMLLNYVHLDGYWYRTTRWDGEKSYTVNEQMDHPWVKIKEYWEREEAARLAAKAERLAA